MAWFECGGERKLKTETKTITLSLPQNSTVSGSVSSSLENCIGVSSITTSRTSAGTPIISLLNVTQNSVSVSCKYPYNGTSSITIYVTFIGY